MRVYMHALSVVRAQLSPQSPIAGLSAAERFAITAKAVNDVLVASHGRDHVNVRDRKDPDGTPRQKRFRALGSATAESDDATKVLILRISGVDRDAKDHPLIKHIALLDGLVARERCVHRKHDHGSDHPFGGFCLHPTSDNHVHCRLHSQPVSVYRNGRYRDQRGCYAPGVAQRLVAEQWSS